jgi:hypothetical protein
MPGEIAPNNSSQYAGSKGKTSVVQQGQTEGAYGSDTNMKRREPDPPADLSV